MRKILNSTEKGIRIICATCLALITITGILQVFFRYIVGNSLSFSEEMMRFLFIWIVFLGAAICIRNHSHAAVEMVVEILSGKLKNIVIIVGTLINIGFLSLLTIKGFEFSLNSHHQLSIAMEIPMSYVYISIPIGSLLMLIYSFEYLYDYFFQTVVSWKERQ